MTKSAPSSLVSEMLEALEEFADDVAANDGEIPPKYTVRHFVLDPGIETVDAAGVKEAREALNTSQRIFAAFLGVSLKTVQAWEQGVNTPSGAAARFMDEIRLDPEHWRKRLLASIRPAES